MCVGDGDGVLCLVGYCCSTIPEEVIADLEQALMICGILQRIMRQEQVDLRELKGANSKTVQADESARYIERGGASIGSGLATAGSLLGSGIKGGTRVAKDHSEKGTSVHITEEERLKQQHSEEQTRKFLKGSRMVTGGIRKGAGFLGKGVAAGVHHGKKTEWYQEVSSGV
jgi:senescence-associated protein